MDTETKEFLAIILMGLVLVIVFFLKAYIMQEILSNLGADIAYWKVIITSLLVTIAWYTVKEIKDYREWKHINK